MIQNPREVQLGAYRPLFEHLSRLSEEKVYLTFGAVEEILGRTLPARARSAGHFWWTVDANQLQARCWLAARRHPFPDAEGVEFRMVDRLTWGDAAMKERDSRSRVAYARGMLLHPPMDFHVAGGWWERHVLYVVHYPDAGVYKVGLTNTRTDRLRRVSRVGEIIDLEVVANRWAATVVEGELLIAFRKARREPPLWVAQWAGSTEFWDDKMTPPPLGTYAWSIEQEAEVAPEDEPVLTEWRTTVMRPAGIVAGSSANGE